MCSSRYGWDNIKVVYIHVIRVSEEKEMKTLVLIISRNFSTAATARSTFLLGERNIYQDGSLFRLGSAISQSRLLGVAVTDCEIQMVFMFLKGLTKSVCN